MLNIKESKLIGRHYTSEDSSKNGRTFTCIGYGQNPTTGAMFLVGEFTNAAGETKIDTDLFRSITLVSPAPI